MSKIKIYIDNSNVIRDRISVLGMAVRSFVERTIGRKCGPVYMDPKKLSREWVRSRIIQLITLSLFTAPTEVRPQEVVLEEAVSRYDTAIGTFIEENLDLIAEIKLATEAEEQ